VSASSSAVVALSLQVVAVVALLHIAANVDNEHP